MLDGIELFERPVDERLEHRGQLFVTRDAAADQLLEVLAIDTCRIFALQELLLDLGGRLLRQLPLIQRLHGQLARNGARPRAPHLLSHGLSC